MTNNYPRSPLPHTHTPHPPHTLIDTHNDQQPATSCLKAEHNLWLGGVVRLAGHAHLVLLWAETWPVTVCLITFRTWPVTVCLITGWLRPWPPSAPNNWILIFGLRSKCFNLTQMLRETVLTLPCVKHAFDPVFEVKVRMRYAWADWYTAVWRPLMMSDEIKQSQGSIS